MIHIYILLDPVTFAVRYVGKTNNPRVRLKSHVSGRSNGTACDKWVKALREAGLRPIQRVIDTIDASEWQSTEQRWIAYYQASGCDLLNRTRGGNGNYKSVEWTPEMRAAMRAKFAGRPIPEWQRKAISKTLTGRKQSPETIAKRKTSILKKYGVPYVVHDVAARSRISQGLKGRTVSPETRAKISRALLGNIPWNKATVNA